MLVLPSIPHAPFRPSPFVSVPIASFRYRNAHTLPSIVDAAAAVLPKNHLSPAYPPSWTRKRRSIRLLSAFQSAEALPASAIYAIPVFPFLCFFIEACLQMGPPPRNNLAKAAHPFLLRTPFFVFFCLFFSPNPGAILLEANEAATPFSDFVVRVSFVGAKNGLLRLLGCGRAFSAHRRRPLGTFELCSGQCQKIRSPTVPNRPML